MKRFLSPTSFYLNLKAKRMVTKISTSMSANTKVFPPHILVKKNSDQARTRVIGSTRPSSTTIDLSMVS
jgi:hypothetical protein